MLIGHKFVCELPLGEFLLSIIHFYAEICKRDIRFQIELVEPAKYQIEIIQIINESAENLIKQYRNQPIPDNIVICSKIYSVINIPDGYTLQNTKETEQIPMTTDVLLLSCGHLLGLESLDEWLRFKYDKCFQCSQSVTYVASFQTVVYRY